MVMFNSKLLTCQRAVLVFHAVCLVPSSLNQRLTTGDPYADDLRHASHASHASHVWQRQAFSRHFPWSSTVGHRNMEQLQKIMENHELKPFVPWAGAKVLEVLDPGLQQGWRWGQTVGHPLLWNQSLIEVDHCSHLIGNFTVKTIWR